MQPTLFLKQANFSPQLPKHISPSLLLIWRQHLGQRLSQVRIQF